MVRCFAVSTWIPLLGKGHNSDDKNHHAGREEYLLTAVVRPFDELKLTRRSIRGRRGFRFGRGERIGSRGRKRHRRCWNPHAASKAGVRRYRSRHAGTGSNGRIPFKSTGGTYSQEQKQNRCAGIIRHGWWKNTASPAGIQAGSENSPVGGRFWRKCPLESHGASAFPAACSGEPSINTILSLLKAGQSRFCDDR
jgi:hypothetical protein